MLLAEPRLATQAGRAAIGATLARDTYGSLTGSFIQVALV
jgi:hypothetical protein